MTSRRDYMSPARAAKVLGIHRNTAYGWARDAIDGERSKFKAVEQHPVTGYIAIPAAEVERIKESEGK